MTAANADDALARALRTLVFSVLIMLLATTGTDPDLWGHVRYGVDLIRERALPEVDPYSYVTEGQRWINHEWLAELAFGAAWLAGGAAGLIALKTLLGLLTLGILHHDLRAQGIAPVRVALLLAALSLPLTLFYSTVRPQLFTYALFALTLVILRRAQSGALGLPWLLPPLFVLWVNLHGGVLAGAGVLALWSCGMFLAQWRDRWRIAAPGLAAAAALAVNPYGVQLPVFLLLTATGTRPEIAEWAPLSLASVKGLLYFVLLAIALFGLRFTARPRHRVSLLLLAIGACLPWLAVRHLPLFAIIVVVFAGADVDSALRRMAASARALTSPAPPALRRWASPLVLTLAMALVVVAALSGTFTRIRFSGAVQYPVAATALLARSGIAANVAVDFNWGQYLIWHVGPRIKVGMDGRRETVYPDAVYAEYVDFARGTRNWTAFLTRHPADLVLVAAGGPPHKLLERTAGWVKVFEDSVSVLFARADSPLLPRLRDAAAAFEPPPPTVFP